MSTDPEKKTLLVIGDWLIDEYWFLARHHSEVSAHTGPLHYRIFSEMHERVRDLAGTGLVMRVLYERKEEDKKNETLSLVGLGKWHENDTRLLQHLIHAPYKKAHNSFPACHADCAPYVVSGENFCDSQDSLIPPRYT